MRRYKWRGIRLYCYEMGLSKSFVADATGVFGPFGGHASYGGLAHCAALNPEGICIRMN